MVINKKSERRTGAVSNRWQLLPVSSWMRNLLVLLLLLALGLYLASAVRQETFKGSIAFVGNRDGNWELFMMRGDETIPVQLTESLVDERSPAISPNGEQIAYATSDGALWVLTLATKATTKLPLPPNRYGFPTWLSDGSGIVYTAYKFAPPDEDADFFVYSFKDGKQQPCLVQTGPQDYPALSPTGETLAYVSSLSTLIPGFGATLTQQLWVASLRDGKPSQLLLGSADNSRPAWSPDGKWMAFSSDRKGTPDVWIANSQGEELAQLTSGLAAETNPTWSPDGQEIAYVSTESGRMQLMLIDVKTRTSRVLSPFGSKSLEVKDPQWK